MTTMNCDDVRARAAEIVDGTEPVDAALEAHLARCEACRIFIADLSRISQVAGTLDVRPLSPGASWSGVREQLLNDPEFARLQRQSPAGPALSWRWLAAAAALIMAVGVSLWFISRALEPGQTPTRTASAPATSVPDGNVEPSTLVESIESELSLAAKHYENAIDGLEKVAQASDAPIDPEVTATLRQNLAIIDKAIDDSRGALKSDPGNRLAQESLFEAFRRKIGLLQDTIALMNEMRKGDQAGAARIVEGLNKS
jgi:hypothetical protein